MSDLEKRILLLKLKAFWLQYVTFRQALCKRRGSNRRGEITGHGAAP